MCKDGWVTEWDEGRQTRKITFFVSSINFRQGKHHRRALSLVGVIIQNRVELEQNKLPAN